jgi:hypothetical protein
MQITLVLNEEDDGKVEIWTKRIDYSDMPTLCGIVHIDDLFYSTRVEPEKTSIKCLKKHLTQFGSLECNLTNAIDELPNVKEIENGKR